MDEVQSYEELSLDELKAEVQARELELPSKVTKKALIELLEANDEATKPPAEAETGTPVPPVPTPASDAVPSTFLGNGVEEVGQYLSYESKAAKMKKHLEQQPKVRIIIPRETNEPVGATLPVQLNGYRLNIKKGVYVDVPEQIAEVVMEHYNQQETALQQGLAVNAAAKGGVTASQALDV